MAKCLDCEKKLHVIDGIGYCSFCKKAFIVKVVHEVFKPESDCEIEETKKVEHIMGRDFRQTLQDLGYE